jgi:outer membrane lipopolysaccharide assembly protein LptE/RlpB
MKNTLKTSFVLALILLINGCGKVEKKEQEPIEKETAIVQMEFGKWNKQNDSLGVELDVNNFENWIDLINRIEKIVCNDSIPKITSTTNSEIKTIYFRNTCPKKDSIRFIKLKNVIGIYNNKISKNNESSIPLDSLENVLRKDIKNNGKNLGLSESSEKLTICVQYDNKNEFKNLPNILNQLTETYYRITNKTDLKILLVDENYFSPPPRPKD